MILAWNTALFFVAFLVGADELLLGPILTPIGNDLFVRPENVTLFVTTYSLANAACAFLFGVLLDCCYGLIRRYFWPRFDRLSLPAWHAIPDSGEI